MAQAAGSQGPDDLALLRGIAGGDEDCFRLFFRRWTPPLGRFLQRVTRSPEVAEDLLQETFLRVLRAAPRFEPHGSVSAWVYRIAANLAYSHWRRTRGVLGPPAPEAPEIAATMPDPLTPDLLRARRAWARDLQAAVGRLPENHRLVFVLKIDEGLTYEQIGEVLGCPTGTAKSRFHHAVLRLRAALRDWEDASLSPHPGRDVHVV
jgi:RNA polymerase sigma-70 factor (ECF subfamily)